MEIFSLIVSLLALALSIFQFISVTAREKKEATLNAYYNLQEDSFKTLNNLCAKRDCGSIDFEKLKPGDEEWETITVCLAKIENFSTGINTNVYSLKILYRLSYGFYVRMFKEFKVIIDKKRRDNVSKGKHYDEFEKTVNKLQRLNKRLNKNNN